MAGIEYRKNIGACSAEGCGKLSQKGGLCGNHYMMRRRYGRLEKVSRPQDPEYRKKYYLRNREKYLTKARAWSAANPVARKAIEQAYRDKNKDVTKARTDKWRKDNLPYCAEKTRRYLAKKLKATPLWLTETHIEQMCLFYVEAARLTKETGIPHEVDHIEPLQGKTVCGLHVPWNLRVITKVENIKKSNKLLE